MDFYMKSSSCKFGNLKIELKKSELRSETIAWDYGNKNNLNEWSNCICPSFAKHQYIMKIIIKILFITLIRDFKIQILYYFD